MTEFRDRLKGFWGTEQFTNKVLEILEMDINVNESGILYLIISYRYRRLDNNIN